MPDPTHKIEAILRITGLAENLKKHIEEKPQFAGLYNIDETSPKHTVVKGELAKLITCRIIPFLLESFSHYRDDEILMWEAGLFNQGRIDSGISEVDVRQAREILQGLLEELE